MGNFCESFTNFALSFIVALFLQQGLGFDAARAGEIMLPSACIWGLTSLATGRLSDRIESRWLILIGSLSQAVSLVLFAGLTPWSSTWAVMVLLTLRSLTRGFFGLGEFVAEGHQGENRIAHARAGAVAGWRGGHRATIARRR